jgi:hypothetical protein
MTKRGEKLPNNQFSTRSISSPWTTLLVTKRIENPNAAEIVPPIKGDWKEMHCLLGKSLCSECGQWLGDCCGRCGVNVSVVNPTKDEGKIKTQNCWNYRAGILFIFEENARFSFLAFRSFCDDFLSLSFCVSCRLTYIIII